MAEILRLLLERLIGHALGPGIVFGITAVFLGLYCLGWAKREWSTRRGYAVLCADLGVAILAPVAWLAPTYGSLATMAVLGGILYWGYAADLKRRERAGREAIAPVAPEPDQPPR